MSHFAVIFWLFCGAGPVWSHCVNTRVVLEQTVDTRILTVAKSPIAPVTQMSFEITVLLSIVIVFVPTW